MLNEFALMFDARVDFPLHYITFRRCGVAKPHEGNTENMFSLSGQLSDRNKLADNLAAVRAVSPFCVCVWGGGGETLTPQKPRSHITTPHAAPRAEAARGG